MESSGLFGKVTNVKIFQNVWREVSKCLAGSKKNGNVEWLRFLSIESHTGNFFQLKELRFLCSSQHYAKIRKIIKLTIGL